MSERLQAAVVVASNRAAAGVYDDTTGPLIVEALEALGFDVTGLTPTDLTPEVTAELLDREVPGIAEAIRQHGVAKGVPTAALSRGLAGVHRDALVVNLPGSRGGVKDGLAVLEPLVVHAVEQIVGSDH